MDSAFQATRPYLLSPDILNYVRRELDQIRAAGITSPTDRVKALPVDKELRSVWINCSSKRLSRLPHQSGYWHDTSPILIDNEATSWQDRKQ